MKKNEISVSIVIPNWNGCALLEKNLPSVIIAARLYNAEIILTDDGSTDDSLAYVKTTYPLIKIVSNTKQIGFAGNVNRGVKQATGEIVVLLNTDVSPHPDFLKYLIPHFQDTNIFAVGCLDESIENGVTVTRGRGIAWWERGLFVHKRGETDATDTAWVSGGSGAFRKSIWEKFGGMDELYNPFYWEDIDLSYRARKAGYAIYFEPKSRVRHYHEKGAILSQFSQQEIIKNSYAHQVQFVWLNISDPFFLLSHFVWMPIHIIRLLIRFDAPLLTVILNSFINIYSIIKKRSINRLLWKISDTKLLTVERSL